MNAQYINFENVLYTVEEFAAIKKLMREGKKEDAKPLMRKVVRAQRARQGLTVQRRHHYKQ